ncbi:3-phosphoserine/phosphohydroxythreonine transaminase [Marinicella sp. S1101]|uniref:3-phosphoserine/phosphohydroxythreonine transaminase n=1 Tax=Marinicella marina TaxID=2996016 RepID=UPI002260ADE5|nr:3-phosphoserine/phosphohydroxythreonine transaminase [Marinicella marina]MCX7553445.1 3-phosphoserine/phosphohydroxythreonine transaminase [Marinicella marina]MDJ1140069.1 3-phosphoserine/phosphohydroxythreonine transaminase [Marinicella marina]
MTVYNFSAGPAALPIEVKQQIEADLYDWNGTGCSVMEMSHRSQEFKDMADENEALARELLNISDDYAVMLIPGGARLQYSMLPINVSSPQGSAVYAINGHWGKQAIKEASRFTQTVSTAPISDEVYADIPDYDAATLNPNADYFHFTSNETLEGVQWHKLPETNGIPLCCDMTSDLLTREFDVDDYSMIYASAQKNMGIAGITFVLMKRNMIGQSKNLIPTMTDYKTYADTRSFYNTPPTFPWYVMLLVLRWVKAQGGVGAIQAANQTKSSTLYDYVDQSGLYMNKVAKNCRSEVNVPFWLADENLNQVFLEQSSAAGLKALKGHMAVGGMRASIYNAIPLSGIETLITFMQEFERTHG